MRGRRERLAVVHPGAFEVPGAGFFNLGAQIGAGEGPNRINIQVLSEGRSKFVMFPGDDVHDPGWDIRCFQHLVKIGCCQREGLARSKDHAIAHRNGRGHRTNQPGQRCCIIAKNTDISDGFLHCQSNATNGHAMRLPVIFVRPCRIGKERAHAGFDLICA